MNKGDNSDQMYLLCFVVFKFQIGDKKGSL